ncbi:SRPBCC domain-containing protein [Streptomyces sp. NPDC048270]|uniref:SRPBCC domain-containing protein n=1 Tax=Streptomyces sp. NPDC048270 TaxID=3154615 RepID=UPI0033C4B34D
MEHQAFVPVPADSLRAVLRDPVRTARCVPGLQQDADTESGPLSGRLKVRVGGHTVTYRGAFSVTERDPGHFAVDGEGTEVRGSGTVKLTLALRLTPEGDGTRLDFTAGATADGRAAGFAPEATATAARRLLDQTAERLAEASADGGAGAPAGGGAAEAGEPGGSGEAAGAGPAAAAGSGGAAGSGSSEASPSAGSSEAPRSSEAAGAEVSDPVADAEEDEAGGADGSGDDDITEVTASVFETDVPPPSLDPFLAGGFDSLDDLGDLPRPPAEAAHARRTMIGRSAEEVDHAPPRGRYAPVPAPAATTAGDNLRWLAPAAALAVASAIVIGRALRRRR